MVFIILTLQMKKQAKRGQLAQDSQPVSGGTAGQAQVCQPQSLFFFFHVSLGEELKYYLNRYLLLVMYTDRGNLNNTQNASEVDWICLMNTLYSVILIFKVSF